jgi:hypothetical protein
MKQHLRMDCYYLIGNPEKVMEGLGITYQHATPQSIADQWWFWNCENIPEQLPDYIKPLQVDPMEAIGNGLDRKTAEEILTYRQ